MDIKTREGRRVMGTIAGTAGAIVVINARGAFDEA